MGYVFVSYARDEAKKIDRILNKLKTHGIEFWKDTDSLKVGDDWSEKIIKAIKGCDRVLLFMSTMSMASDNVAREVHFAFKKKKDIIMLRLDDVKVPDSLDYQIGRIQWADYSLPGWEIEIAHALGGSKATTPKKSMTRPSRVPKAAHTTISIPKKVHKAQVVIAEIEEIFTSNGKLHKDQCVAAITKLEELQMIASAHWINPSLAYKESVSRQYLLDKIEIVQDLIREFQETCPPGSIQKKHVIQSELTELSRELSIKINK